MLWWQKSSEFLGHVEEALAHINEARELLSYRATRTCELYFHALNKLWIAHAQYAGEPTRADTPAFIALLKDLGNGHEDFLRNEALQRLIDFSPEVLDHSTLKTHGYYPGQMVSDTLRYKATERHRKLRNAHSRWRAGDGDSGNVFKKLAEFLYIIRSNIAHGEKSPYGPDLEKVRRDEKVSALTVPVLEGILDRVLGLPSLKLVAYDTLKPGGANSAWLEDLPGTWRPCRIRGSIDQINGLPAYQSNSRGQAVEATLFESHALPNRWSQIDQFEGHRYHRWLVSLWSEGAPWIANCYVSAVEEWTG